jgi:hypothetical protein
MKSKKYRKPKHHKVTRKTVRRRNIKTDHRKKHKTMRRKKRVRKNRTRKLKGGGLFDRLTSTLRRNTAQTPESAPNPPVQASVNKIYPPSNEQTIKDAHNFGRETYQSTMDKEFVVGQWGQTLRDTDSKMDQARKDAQSAVTKTYGPNTWRQIHHHFPGKPIPIPEQTIQDLSSIFPTEWWEDVLSKMKFSAPLEKELFMDTLFVDKKTYELRGAFLKPGLTTVDIRNKVTQTLGTPAFTMPFIRRRFSEDELNTIENKVVRKIEGFVNFFQTKLAQQLELFAIKYWKDPSKGNGNYNRTKNHIIERFGEGYWLIIKENFQREIRSMPQTTGQ